MTFIWPAMLVSLVLIPVFVGVYLRLQRRRTKLAASYGGAGLSASVPGKKQSPLRRHIPMAFFLVGLAILAFALARPQAVVALPKQVGTVILAFDVSGSMAADDIKPTRMEAAKVAAGDFVKHQPFYVQTGVVAFSDSGLSVQVPTTDTGAVQAAIDRLVPQTGTSVGQGILASLSAIANGSEGPPAEIYSNLLLTPTPTPTPVPPGTNTSAVIILLSDGENNENPDPLAAAQTAAQRGVRIYTVGIGSPTGTTVHIKGFSIHTQLDEATLKQISQITGGTYYNAKNAQDLLKIYDQLDKQVLSNPEKTELTALFTGAGIFLMLAGGLFSLLWLSRLP